MDLSAYAPKDAKLIRDNEGKTAYELLNLGLSQKAYERLTENRESEITAPKQKAPVIPPTPQEGEGDTIKKDRKHTFQSWWNF